MLTRKVLNEMKLDGDSHTKKWYIKVLEQRCDRTSKMLNSHKKFFAWKKFMKYFFKTYLIVLLSHFIRTSSLLPRCLDLLKKNYMRNNSIEHNWRKKIV